MLVMLLELSAIDAGMACQRLGPLYDKSLALIGNAPKGSGESQRKAGGAFSITGLKEAAGGCGGRGRPMEIEWSLCPAVVVQAVANTRRCRERTDDVAPVGSEEFGRIASG
jgi:hypothetical protein